MKRSALLSVAVLALAGPAFAAEPRPKGTVTFTRDIAPIVFQHCATCHRPGEVAPFALLTYRDVAKRAKQIQRVTEKKVMPPWKIVPGHGEFIAARKLGADEIGLIRQWAEEGAVEGDPKDLPPAPKFADGWQLGKPDLVVQLARPYAVPAEGADIYRNFVIPVAVPEGKYLKAAEYRPGNRRVVHHAALGLDLSGEARRQDTGDGFTRFTLPGQFFPGSLAAWVPGRDPRPLPEGLSMPWRKGVDLVLQLHLHPSGKPETEMSLVGLYFTDQPPRRSTLDLLLIDRKIDIKPGDPIYKTRDAVTVPADVEVWGIFPHMHLLGKDVKVTATLPDGSQQSLLWIEDWDFKWQNFYEYAKPVKLPKGTQLLMECVHDNSAANPNQPVSPPRRVTWGEQTNDEMSAVFLQLVPARESDTADLAKALGPRIVGRIYAGNAGAAAAADVEKEAAALIKKLDKDGDGQLSLAELAAFPGAAGKDLKPFLARFDKDGDGKLDMKELAEALRVLTGR